MPITKLRVARGLKANLPTPPNGFEPGRPYFATDTRELFIGVGLNSPMVLVAGSSSGSGGTPAFELNGIIIDASTGSGLTIADSLPADPVEGQQVWVTDGSTTIGGLYVWHNGSWIAATGITQTYINGAEATLTINGPTVPGNGGFVFVGQNPNLTTISYPELTSISAGGYFFIDRNPILESIDLSALTTVGDFTWMLITNNKSLVSMDFTALTHIGNSAIFQLGGPGGEDNGLNLTSLSFPALTSIGTGTVWNTTNIDLSWNGGLTSVSLPALTSIGTAGIYLAGCALTEESVNLLLTQLATNITTAYSPGWVPILDISQGTNAAPTGDGLTAMATLQGNGWNVQVNS